MRRPARLEVAGAQRVGELARRDRSRTRRVGLAVGPRRRAVSRRAATPARVARRWPWPRQRRAANGESSRVRDTPESMHHDRCAVGQRERLDRAVLRVEQDARRPTTIDVWSATPHGTPVARCSARCATSTRVDADRLDAAARRGDRHQHRERGGGRQPAADRQRGGDGRHRSRLSDRRARPSRGARRPRDVPRPARRRTGRPNRRSAVAPGPRSRRTGRRRRARRSG